MSVPLRLPQVFVSPRQWINHWRHCGGGCQALVKSAPPAIPFDTPVTGMVRPGGKRLNASCPQSPRAHQWSFRFLLPSLWWPLSRGLPRDVHPSGNFLRISKTATIPWILIKNAVGSSYLRGTLHRKHWRQAIDDICTTARHKVHLYKCSFQPDASRQDDWLSQRVV